MLFQIAGGATEKMSAMVSFVNSVLFSLADFLVTEPIYYLFGAVIFLFICKGIKSLIS